ncbi:LAME_0E13520g1_1 [Lachancea meyersii CBS 8951]|uniref:Mitochondrial genome maintenance protein MGM101 n=1 Tax=Lachancea meyersii CBS 8951 TaxID=1266667 RepID=A0A1G4JMR1_9SACH|nr:LAME_0E13520g1_1 [Lachancea meyersii CBS 8951]
MFLRRASMLPRRSRTVVTAVKRVVNARPPVSSTNNENASPATISNTDQPSTVSVSNSQSYGQPLNRAFKGYALERSGPRTSNSIPQQLDSEINWAVSFKGLGSRPFDDTVQVELSKPISPEDIEVKPDGLLYLPEIKYRRILNKAFGAGGWGLVPRSETTVTDKLVTREYALICHGQLVSLARGEQDYFADSGIPTATEGCKSNALMRCCKDLGIGSELWDPVFIKQFKKAYCVDKFVEHVTTKKKRKIWLRKDREVEYPYK